MNNPPEKEPDSEQERPAKKAKSNPLPAWDKGDVLLNCICLVVSVLLCVVFGLIPLLILGLTGVAVLAFGGSSANQQVGRSIVLGCFIGCIYLVVINPH